MILLLGSARNLVRLLRLWIRSYYDDYLCRVASNKQQIYVGRSQTSSGELGKCSTSKRIRIVQKIAPPSLSCVRRIKNNYRSDEIFFCQTAEAICKVNKLKTKEMSLPVLALILVFLKCY